MTSGNDAIISENGLYRYRLSRCLNPNISFIPAGEIHRLVVWIMLNPSTADASTDDATIRKVLGFSKIWGYSMVDVYNLFAFRATDPMDLFVPIDPVGPDNGFHLRMIPDGVKIIAAWGSSGLTAAMRAGRQELYSRREAEVKQFLRSRQAVCLGKCAGGEPRHPVRLPYSAGLEVYP